jgi:uncharacterized protein (TIGR00290 family)
MSRPRVALSWSSGKDSAWTLHRLRQDPGIEVAALVTTVNAEFNRVAMHAVRQELLHAQAEAAGLPLIEVPIPYPCSNAEYESRMRTLIERLRGERIERMAFGDLYLADIRAYREQQLQGTGIAPLFPLWNEPTAALARNMIAGGLRAVLTCVDPKQLAPAFCGRRFDAELLDTLPTGVDPCGENGEFHSFACAGPMFRAPIAVEAGETVERDGFVFTDLRRRRNGSDDIADTARNGFSSQF